MRDARRRQSKLHRAAHDGIGARKRRSGRQLRHDDDVAAVHLRYETDRRLAEFVHAEGEHRHVADEHDRGEPHDARGQPAIAARQRLEAAIEAAEKAMDRPLPPALAAALRVRLEQQRAHGRRQRQRNNERDHGCARDGQRELPVELPGNPRDEGRRYEDRAQHERDRDQRRAHLVHALVRRIARGEALRNVALDVFNHDDGVVHHDADGEHETEQRQIVQRKAEHRHEEERTDERYRNGDEGNDRSPPRLQEYDHDQHDQQHRLKNGADNGIHRLLDELRRVVDDVVFYARRKAHAEPLHRIDHRLRCGERVRARPLKERERDRRIAVEVGVRHIILRREFDARHVP